MSSATTACHRSEAVRAPKPLVIAVPYELDTLDPHAEDRLSSFALIFNIYEPLVDVDADMKIRPSLAATWESPDPLTWVFHLRPSVTFHSGRPLRSADVVYSLQRLKGDPQLQVRNFTRDVTQVEAIDDHTLRLKTAVPSRMLLAKLCHVAIVPEGASGDSLEAKPDGTGPYTLSSWHPGEVLRLRRYDGYWRGAPGAPAEVAFSMGRSPEEALAGLLDGRYQFVKSDSRKAEQALARSGEYTLQRRESLYIKYLALDLAREVTPFCAVRPTPFRDNRVRRALSASVDRKRLVAALSSQAVPATQPVPRFVFGFEPGIPEASVDLGLARSLLREAGLGAGFEVVLHARSFVREAASAVQADLQAIGIRAEVRPVTEAAFFQLLHGGGMTLWLTRVGCDTGDSSEFFEDLIHSRDAPGRFGSLNHGGYSNPKLDAEIERSVALEAPRDRLQAFHEIMRTVVGENAIVPLYNDMDVYALDRSLTWTARSDGEVRAVDVVVRP